MSTAHALYNMTITEISLTGDPANEDSTVEIVKAKQAKRDDPNDSNPDADDELIAGLTQERTMNLQEMQAALDEARTKITGLEGEVAKAKDGQAKAEQERDAAKAEIAKSKADAAKTPEQQDEEFLKSLPPAVRENLLKERAENKAMREEFAKAQAKAEEEAEFAKAKGLGFGDPAKIAPAMVNIRKGKPSAEDLKVLDETLALASGIAKGGVKVLTAVRGADNAVNATDPEAKIDAGARALVAKAKEAGRKLTHAQAVDEFIQTDEGKAAYEEVSKAKRAAVAS